MSKRRGKPRRFFDVTVMRGAQICLVPDKYANDR